MIIITSSVGPKKKGYALIITLVFLGIMLTLFGTMMLYTVSNANLTKRNNQYNASEAAAEAAAEKVLSQMTHDFENESLSNSASYYASSFLPSSSQMAGWPVQYKFSSPTTNTTGQIGVTFGPWTTNTVPLNSQYAGLYGLEQDCTIAATATPTTAPAVPATVTESVQFALIPLFQFAIFYNMNLEIAAASTLNIKGAVYSNGGIWSGSSTITFSSTVSAVGIATNTANDPFVSWGSGYSGSGASHYTLANQPTSGNDTITMPVGTNNDPNSVEAIVNLPPSTYQWGTANAFTTNGQLYLANEADLFLTNAYNGTNWGSLVPQGTNMFLYYQDADATPYETFVTNDYYILKTGGWTNHISQSTTAGIDSYTNVQYAGYSFLTNSIFYDWREGWHGGSGPPKTVQAVQIDLGLFSKWLTNAAVNGGSNLNALCRNDKTHPIDSIYIYNAVPLTSTTLPAVRIVNGGRLPPGDDPNGFSLATAMPLYVWGDYNASNSLGSDLGLNSDAYTEPSALFADSITIFSDAWNDTNSLNANKSKDTSGGFTASATTINAACLEGIVESTNNSSSDANGYSGGVENFLRLLENWGSKQLTYNGSIVVMFPSRFATNCWQQTGGYYSAASRAWAFNTNFFIGNDLPPLTPKSQGVIRATWGAY